MTQSLDTVYINFYANINSQSVQHVMNICTQLINEHKPSKLYFAISSNGGDVAAGFTLYNFLVSLPADIAMHNVGTVDSVATVIFLAASERYAAPHSTFLYHGVTLNVGGPMSFTIEQLSERVGSLAADEARIAEVIADKTNLDVIQINTFQKQGETLNPSAAKVHGIVHDIRDVSIPNGAPIINISM